MRQPTKGPHKATHGQGEAIPSTTTWDGDPRAEGPVLLDQSPVKRSTRHTQTHDREQHHERPHEGPPPSLKQRSKVARRRCVPFSYIYIIYIYIYIYIYTIHHPPPPCAQCTLASSGGCAEVTAASPVCASSNRYMYGYIDQSPVDKDATRYTRYKGPSG